MSQLNSGRRARRLRTATIMASRLRSTPRATRCGMARLLGATSACTSASRQRVPSSTGTTTEPERRSPSSRNTEDGSGTSTSPCSAIWNTPTSLVEPKRFLTARRMRNGCARSPSKERTASTMCSSTRGPASSPSLVTWPTRIRAMPLVLATCSSCAVTSRIWATEPGVEPTADDHRVWTESTTQADGCSCSSAATTALGLGLGESRRPLPPPPRRTLRSLTWAADSSPETSRVETPRASMPSRACSSRVLLPTPGSPPTRTTDPATRPPPSTRLSSPRPVSMRSPACRSRRRPEHRTGAGAASRRPHPGCCPSGRPRRGRRRLPLRLWCSTARNPGSVPASPARLVAALPADEGASCRPSAWQPDLSAATWTRTRRPPACRARPG